MGRHIDTLPRVRLSPADWERVEAMAQRESRSVANMLGVLVAEAMAARLAEVVRAINAGLPESPICTQCHRPLVVPQVVEHLEWSEGWLHQGGDLPQT